MKNYRIVNKDYKEKTLQELRTCKDFSSYSIGEWNNAHSDVPPSQDCGSGDCGQE